MIEEEIIIGKQEKEWQFGSTASNKNYVQWLDRNNKKKDSKDKEWVDKWVKETPGSKSKVLMIGFCTFLNERNSRKG